MGFRYVWIHLEKSNGTDFPKSCLHKNMSSLLERSPPPQMEKLDMMSRMPQESLGLLREVTILHLKLVSWSSLARLCLIHSRYLIGGMGVIRKQ